MGDAPPQNIARKTTPWKSLCAPLWCLGRLLSWIPIFGSVVTIAMGYVRTSILPSIVSILLGKYLRYQVLVSAWQAAFS